MWILSVAGSSLVGTARGYGRAARPTTPIASSVRPATYGEPLAFDANARVPPPALLRGRGREPHLQPRRDAPAHGPAAAQRGDPPARGRAQYRALRAHHPRGQAD